jgi:hypothetical protein
MSDPQDATLLDWSSPAAAPDAETVADPPAFSNTDLVEDLGFSLDWSDPERATTPEATPDDLGFPLEWSEPLAAQFLDAGRPIADTGADYRISSAHWDDPVDSPLEPAPSGDGSAEAPSTGEVTADRDPALDTAEPRQLPNTASESRSPAAVEQEQAQPAIDQEAPPWYTPTLHLDDHPSLDASGEVIFAAPPETLDPAWAESQAASAEIAAVNDRPPAEALEAGRATEDQLPTVTARFEETPLDMDDQPPAEALGAAWAEPTAVMSQPARTEASGQPSAQDAAPPEIPSDLVARMIGMIQSYGPAWFKMWSLELRERPERLPVVLGEVTADPVLLAQADDPRVQSALLLALAAYSAPAAFPPRLPAPAPLPSQEIAGQSNDTEDDVPDWLSLRVKWNGQGGGA